MTEIVRIVMLVVVGIVIIYYVFLLSRFLMCNIGNKTNFERKKCIGTICYIIIMLVVEGMYFFRFGIDIAATLLIIIMLAISFYGKFILTFLDIRNK